MPDESNFQAIATSSDLDFERLWTHQKDEVMNHSYDPTRALLWEPRVGKTRATLGQAREWFNLGLTRMLVVAPQTVCETVWEKDIRSAFPVKMGTRSVEIVPLYSGTLLARKASIRRLVYLKNDPTHTIIAIVNRDALYSLVNELAAWEPQALVLDELHDYKNPSSRRHLAALRLAKPARFIRGLTGTPTPRSYADIYGQWKILAPSIFGTNQSNFRDRYLFCDPRFPSRIIGYRNTEELRAKAFAIAGIKTREECFDIPKKQEVVRKVNLPENVKALYRKIVDEHVFEVGEDGKLLSLDHALSRLTTLQQIAGGYLPKGLTEDGEAKWVHDALLDAAEAEVDDILESDKKVVIFHRFTEEGEHLAKRLGAKAAVLRGSTKPAERARIIEAFADPAKEWPKVLIVQEEVGSVGISFATADYCIFYSCGFNGATHTQARDRIFKPATDENSKMTYIYLTAVGTVHAWVLRLIRSKQSASEVLLKGTFRSAALGE